MATRACLISLVVAVTVLFSEYAVSAGTHERSEVQRLLRRLNKPPVATIESPDGYIIDCVHISKQPAFDNPILKNHTIQMWPSSYPRGSSQESNVARRPFIQTWHKNGKCPKNTVPIRRTKEEDVLRADSVSSYGKKKRSKFSELAVTTGHQWAEASAQGYSRYYGTKANINLWQPTVQTASDFSLTQFWVSSGSYQNNDLNTIEVGWQVYPQIYGDNSPKLFIYWTRDAYNKTGCYNLCSGFVQTNNEIAFGVSQLNPLSSYGGAQYDICILVWKDPGTGNWWLQVEDQNIGYWPSSIFTNLASSASTVQWGGEVFSSSAGQTSTQMGSGHLPSEGFSKSSYIRNILVVDAYNTLRSPSGLGLFASRPNCYNVAMGGAGTNWDKYFYYGGPGRNANCQ